MSSETERLHAHIDASLKNLVDADDRTMTDVVEAALWREYGGEKKSAIEARIEQKKDRIEAMERERDELEKSIAEQKKDLAAMQERAQKVSEQKDELTESLDDVLDTLEVTGVDETYFPAVESDVESLAVEHDATKAELVDRLKRRAAEQDRDIYDVQFLSMNEAKQKLERGHNEQRASEAFDTEDDR